MTRKHYVAIASILKKEYDDAMFRTEDFREPNQVQGIAEELADYFATENANFDRTRFLTACGIES